MNMDRHTNNYGFLRDRQTGKILSLAPLFDHNIALVSRGYPSSATQKGGLLSRLFVELLEEEPQAQRDLLTLGLTPPTEEMVRRAVSLANNPPFGPEVVREDFLVEFVLSADRWITGGLNL